MRLLLLAALVLMVLVALAVIRARRLSRIQKAMDRGYYAQRIDIGDNTIIRLMRFGFTPRNEAVIPHNDPDYSNRVIEEFAAAQVKADDWNSTNRALNA